MVMQALHGIHPELARNGVVLGVGCLKEILFVVLCPLMPLTRGEMDKSFSYRNTATNGMTEGQVRVKQARR